MTRRLLLIRHGDVGSAYRGRYLGLLDVPLGELGRRQAAALGQALNRESVASWISSPLQRAKETMQHAWPGMTLMFDEGLREMDFGAWDGRSFDEIADTNPQDAQRWAEGDMEFAFPGGESLPSFRARIENVLQRMVVSSKADIGIMAHGGVLREILRQLLHLKMGREFCFRVDYASISEVSVFSQGATLIRWNDCSHLAALHE